MVLTVIIFPVIRRPLQSVQSAQCLEKSGIWKLLVWDGHADFLVELLLRSHYDLYRLTEELWYRWLLSGIDTMETNPVPILYQSGYLTIKGYDKRFVHISLGLPLIGKWGRICQVSCLFIWLHQSQFGIWNCQLRKRTGLQSVQFSLTAEASAEFLVHVFYRLAEDAVNRWAGSAHAGIHRAQIITTRPWWPQSPDIWNTLSSKSFFMLSFHVSTGWQMMSFNGTPDGGEWCVRKHRVWIRRYLVSPAPGNNPKAKDGQVRICYRCPWQNRLVGMKKAQSAPKRAA